MSEHKGIGWMYDGVKADAHREDYLLGKTIDKNFEKYSDAVIVQKEEAVDALAKTRVVGTTSSVNTKISSLPLNVMKSEDPLVAIRVKEESKRRDVLENPLTKLRFQKQMKEMMEKMSKKAAKKEKKKRKESVSSDDDSSSDEKRKKKKKEKKHKKVKEESDDDRGRKDTKRKRRDSSSDDDRKRKDNRDERRSERRDDRSSRGDDSRRYSIKREKSRDRSEEKRRRRDSSEEEMKKRKRRDSSGDGRRRRMESNGNEKRNRRDSHEQSRRVRRDSSSEDERRVEKERRDSSEEKRKDKKDQQDKRRDFDSHIPAHLRPGSSSEDEKEKEKEDYDREEKASKAKWEGYGLVGAKKKEKSDEKDVKNPYELKKIPKFTVHEKSERKRPLTEEEKDAKLKEFESNAKWRDDLRVSNAKRTQLEDEKEEKDDDGRPASFVKPLLNSVADELSMEDRLKQRKKQLQRGHGYMDKL